MIIIKLDENSISSKEKFIKIKVILTQLKNSFIVVVPAFKGISTQLKKLGESALKNNHITLIEELRQFHLNIIKILIPEQEQPAMMAYLQERMLFLKDLCNSVNAIGELSPKTKAKILAQGELLSLQIIHEFFALNNISLNNLSWENSIETFDDNYINPNVNFEATNENCKKITKDKNYICTGRIAKNSQGEMVVLKKLSTDYYAAVLAYCLNAKEVIYCTDNLTIQNADSSLVKEAKIIEKMSYAEAFEMAYFDSLNIYPQAINLSKQKSIPISIRSIFDFNGQYTRIKDMKDEPLVDNLLAVCSLSNITIVTISANGLSDSKPLMFNTLKTLENKGIKIILTIQTCSDYNICFAIRTEQSSLCKSILKNELKKQIELSQIKEPIFSDNHSILALIGDNLKNQIGFSPKVFSVLSNNNINIETIAQGISERNISLSVCSINEKKAVNLLYKRFFQGINKSVNLFVIGNGKVSRDFLKIVYKQKGVYKEKNKVEFKIVGIANSNKLLLNKQGISSQEASQFTNLAQSYQSEELIEKIKEITVGNKIVIDTTASENISELYADFIKNGISVATCNKQIANHSLKKYQEIKDLYIENDADFQYETSIGVSIPIIKTLEDLQQSGNTITRIDAAISSSLNYIFSTYHYSEDRTFSSIVKEAQEKGYTEDDPRTDLMGKNFIHKMLILAREAGYTKEIEHISFRGFLSEKALNAKSVNEFYQILEQEEHIFKKIFQEAKESKTKLVVVGQFFEDNISIGVRKVKDSSPFYHLKHQDNIISIYTNIFDKEPIVIKSSGTNSQVTAAGIFSEVIYIASKRS